MKLAPIALLFALALAGGPTLANPLAQASKAEKVVLDAAIKDCGVPADSIKYYDNKANWASGKLAAEHHFKTVQSKSPAQIKQHAPGIDPALRSEVNFAPAEGGKLELFKFKNPLIKKACQFVFAFPATGADDHEVSKALKNLGWLPEAGKTSYFYMLKLPANTEYVSNAGKVSAASEVALPLPVKYSQISAAFEIDSKGKLTKLELPQ